MTDEAVNRRLAAILAADVVGYSRLMGEDEVGTLAALTRHLRELIEPAIAGHRGRLVKTTGDGLLAEFASAVDAVRCALAIQAGMATRNAEAPEAGRIVFRVGVNLGDIIFQDDDVFGDGVNIAARLEALAEPGGICVSAGVRDNVRNRVPAGFEYLGEKTVKNIAEPVRAWRVVAEGTASTAAARQRRRAPPMRAAAGLALLIALAGGLWWWRAAGPGGADLPGRAAAAAISIAVLPFANMSDDPAQEYFSDGVTGDLITDLSRLSGLFVIARSTVFTYKGRNVAARQVADELGVRYVLEGSVRKSGGRVRINARLVDSTTGGPVWADRYDRQLGDIFALQDDVTQKIVRALELQLTTNERARIAGKGRDTTPEVYDQYLRGVQALRRYTVESIAESRVHFLRALALDPGYARAWATMAFTYTAGGIFFQTERTDEAIRQAIHYGERALELDATLPQGHFAMAIVFLRQGRHADAREAALEALRHDPNYADGFAALANVELFSGDGAAAITSMQRAMKLNPRYSAAYIDLLGRAYFIQGDYRRAVAEFKRCTARDPALFTCHAFLAATYGVSGRKDEAEWEAQELLGIEPSYTLKDDTIAPQIRRAEDRKRYLDGLRAAGIPAG